MLASLVFIVVLVVVVGGFWVLRIRAHRRWMRNECGSVPGASTSAPLVDWVRSRRKHE